MSTAAIATSSLTAKFANPLIIAVDKAFDMLLGCRPQRTGLTFKDGRMPEYELSAVIGLTGKAVGTIVLSLTRQTALNVLYRMVDVETQEINDDVRDAVGELTNIVAGQTKAQLEPLQLRISIPSIIEGRDHVIHYPSGIQPISILFDSEIGAFSVEAGFKDSQLA